MRRITPLALAAALACGSNPSIVPAGDFSGPEGLAIAQLSRLKIMPEPLSSEMIVLSDDSALAPSVRLEGGS